MVIKTNKELISIVIPVYNSENTIKDIVDSLQNELNKSFYFEIILINDNSKDNSENVCLKCFDNYDNVKFVSLGKNFGEHNAVMAGLSKAKGNFAVIMDDDFQNPIFEVINLINYAIDNNQFDVVYTYYDKKRHSIFKNVASNINDSFANILLRKPRNLYLSSFKLISRYVIDEIIKYDLPFPYIDGLILRCTDKIGQLKVEHHKRVNGVSGYSIKKMFTIWLNMFTNFSILPLRITVILGFIFSIVGFVLGIISVYEKFSNPQVPIGYASIFVSITFFSGILLIAIGMLGEYIGRIFLSQNKSPQFTIRKYFEKDNT